MEKERCQNYNGIFFCLRKEKHGKIAGLPQRERADLVLHEVTIKT